jgi:hypothetical protein
MVAGFTLPAIAIAEVAVISAEVVDSVAVPADTTVAAVLVPRGQRLGKWAVPPSRDLDDLPLVRTAIPPTPEVAGPARRIHGTLSQAHPEQRGTPSRLVRTSIPIGLRSPERLTQVGPTRAAPSGQIRLGRAFRSTPIALQAPDRLQEIGPCKIAAPSGQLIQDLFPLSTQIGLQPPQHLTEVGPVRAAPPGQVRPHRLSHSIQTVLRALGRPRQVGPARTAPSPETRPDRLPLSTSIAATRISEILASVIPDRVAPHSRMYDSGPTGLRWVARGSLVGINWTAVERPLVEKPRSVETTFPLYRTCSVGRWVWALSPSAAWTCSAQV